MMFDGLHDPDPPTPGLHELAGVAARAREIRRHRSQAVMRASLVVVLLALASAVLYASGTDSPQPASSGGAVDPGRTTYSFDEAAEITGLAPIVVDAPVPATSGDASLRLAPTPERGGVCLERAGVAPSCTAGAVSFHHLTWRSAVDEGPFPENPTTPHDRVAIVVAPEVQVAFITVNVTCSRGEFPGAAQLWLCAGLDVSRAYIQVLGPDHVLIGAPPARP